MTSITFLRPPSRARTGFDASGLPLARIVVLLTVYAASASASSSAQAAAGRQLCRFPDGEQRVVQQELAATFGLSISECRAMPRPAEFAIEADATLPEVALTWPKESDVRVTVINLPPPLPRRAAPPSWAPPAYQRLIARSARSHGVDPQVVEAVMYVESRFEPNAQSHKGAVGLMQLMPTTAAQACGVQTRARMFDPATNIECGTRYLAGLTAYFSGRVDLAVAAYNAGPGAVVRHGWRVPPFAETQAYVARVQQRLNASR